MNNKQELYENIMSKLAEVVKSSLNEENNYSTIAALGENLASQIKNNVDKKYIDALENLIKNGTSEQIDKLFRWILVDLYGLSLPKLIIQKKTDIEKQQQEEKDKLDPKSEWAEKEYTQWSNVTKEPFKIPTTKACDDFSEFRNKMLAHCKNNRRLASLLQVVSEILYDVKDKFSK